MNTDRITEALFAFIDNSPTAFHAAANAAERLEGAGYKRIEKEAAQQIAPGGKYYMTRNDSALIAFRIPEGGMDGLRIAASHSDSPCFKVKETPEMSVEGRYTRLNTEGYGGMIMSTWMDRALSVAGRVIVKADAGNGNEDGNGNEAVNGAGAGAGNRMETRLVNIDRDLCVIPNVAIHFNREINKGYTYNPQIDLIPLFSAGAPAADEAVTAAQDKASASSQDKAAESGQDKAAAASQEGGVTLLQLCAQELGVDEEQILASDLYLYNRDKGRRMGAKRELIGAPRLDDLQCAFGTLEGFLAGEAGCLVDEAGNDAENDAENNSENNARYGAVYALFDNEEIGSGTKQGADSTFLEDVIACICDGLGLSGAQRRDLLAGSFLLSADNAHGVHPNHPEKSDPTNRPYLNGGIVLKFQGSQKYTTDAVSAAVVRDLCRRAQVPCQNFANRADVAGGSTLGNISSAHVSVPAADIGLPQLAMHSAFETGGVLDTGYLVKLSALFFQG